MFGSNIYPNGLSLYKFHNVNSILLHVIPQPDFPQCISTISKGKGRQPEYQYFILLIYRNYRPLFSPMPLKFPIVFPKFYYSGE